jgi:hypothetical protein
MRGDAEQLSKIAERYCIELEHRSPQSHRVGALANLGRVVRRARQWVVRKVREVVQDHWDVGVFDVAFGSLKAFGVYPALYYAGWAWTIPIMEYAPLNTQLWTAAYLFARGRILNEIGRRRFGHGLDELDALRDRLLRIRPRDARHIHRFTLGGVERTVRVRTSRMRAWWDGFRGRSVPRNVVSQSELRRHVGDREFLAEANELRGNPYLYEAVLIQKLLGESAGRAKLLEISAPVRPEHGEARALVSAIGETSAATRARVVEQGDSLATALRRNFGPHPSATAFALRCLHWSLQRRIYREMAALATLEYRLLADLLEGRRVDASPQRASMRRKQAQIRRWIERAGRFSERAKRATSRAGARVLIQSALREARSLGLSVRLARAAAWLGAAAPAPRTTTLRLSAGGYGR